MENQEPKKTRRPRRKKQVEVIVDSPSVDPSELKAQGFEKTRAHDASGKFVKDDPSTPENEAFEWVKPKESAPKEEPVKAEVKPWKRPCRPMTKRQATGEPRGVRKRK